MTDAVIVGGFLIQILTLVGGIVWGVGRVQGSTHVLGATIASLSDAVGKLEAVVERIDRKVDDHGERLARVEATVGRRE